MRILQLGLLIALTSGVAAIIVYVTGLSWFSDSVSEEDLRVLESLQSEFRQCVRANGLGLQALSGSNYCQITIQFPSDTVSKWRDPVTNQLEGLSFEFDLCETLATWEQVRNSTTILTKEFIDALLNGWQEYAWRRINKGLLLNNCKNNTVCMEKLALVLPESPPYVPRQFACCAVVGNSGDLLKTNFGEEIDGYDAVIRENGAPIQNFTKYVGKKSTFRLLNRGSAKALDKVVELDDARREVLIIKTTIHDIMNKMIQEIPINNPVYLMLGASFGSAAKGTGLKALEFSLSICDSLDVYRFTVDPGYEECSESHSDWRSWFSQDLILLRVQKRTYSITWQGLLPDDGMPWNFNREVKWVPSKTTLHAALIASEKLLRRVGAGTSNPLHTCSIIKKRSDGKGREITGLRKEANKHRKYVNYATMYPLQRSLGQGMLCTITAD